MLNPSEPNVSRKIILNFDNDEDGNTTIRIDSEGFNGNEDYVALYLHNTLSIMSEINEIPDPE